MTSRLPSISRPVVILIACTLLIAVPSLFCWLLMLFLTSLSVTDDLPTTTTIAEISLPSTAQNIRSHTEGFQETLAILRFDLPRPDLALFLHTHGCDGPLQKVDQNDFKLALPPSWWSPKVASQLHSCKSTHGNFTRVILIDQSQPEIVTMYVIAYIG